MDYIEGFLADCLARGLTGHTIETYRSQVKEFLLSYNEPYSVNLEDLKKFLGSLRARGLAGSTLKGYFAAISSFYDYLIFSGAMDANLIPSFRKRYLRIKDQEGGGENERQLISIQQMQLLVSAAASVRDKALIMMLAKTGMRIGECRGLKVGDINTEKGIIRIPAKAKRSNRLAFMDLELRDILDRYLAWRAGQAKSDWLWISNAGGRIHKDVPNRILASLAEPLGFHDPDGQLCSKFTCHCCRHWFTTHLHRAKMDPEYIKWLRGDSLKKDAWQRYNHIDNREVREEYLRKIPQLLSFDQKISYFERRNNR